nr:hypothetical protein [uncultured Glaciecola sp.]
MSAYTVEFGYRQLILDISMADVWGRFKNTGIIETDKRFLRGRKYQIALSV